METTPGHLIFKRKIKGAKLPFVEKIRERERGRKVQSCMIE